MARALRPQPAVVFADEPTGNLDSKASARGARPAAPRGRRVRPDDHHGHARRRGRRVRRPAASSSPTAASSTTARPQRRGGPRPHEGVGADAQRRAPRAAAPASCALALTALAVVARRRADRRHVRPHRHDRRSFDNDLRRVGAGHRRRRHAASETIGTSTRRRPPTVSADDPRSRSQRGRRRAGADGRVFDAAPILGKDGKRIGARRRAELHRLDRAAALRRVHDVEGRQPRTADEVAIDAGDRRGQASFKLGDTIADRRRPRRARTYTLVGIAQFGGVDSLRRRAPSPCMTLPEAQRWPASRAASTRSTSPATPGVVADAAQGARRAPRCRRARSTCAPAQEQARQAVRGHQRRPRASCTTALLVFAGIALFVGAFIIFNTFSITVAQRTREFALLRTLGASRRQILRSVVVEALADRRRRLGLGLLAGLAARAGAARRCSRRSASTCPSTRHGDRDADGHRRRCSSARSSPCSRPGAGAARDARRRRSRRCARASAPPRRRVARASPIARRRARAIGVALMLVGLFGGSAARARAGAARRWARCSCSSASRCSARCSSRRSPRVVGRPLERVARHHRAAGARERDRATRAAPRSRPRR